MRSPFHRWRGRSRLKDYESFDLRISKVDARYRAEVDAPGGGEAWADFDPPFTREELRDLLSNLGVARRDARVARPDLQQTVRRIGTELFRAVFQKKVAALWEERLRRAQGGGYGVRLRLRLKEAELADWPWEYLCDPEDDFLAVSPETPIVRYPEMMVAGCSLRVRGPLRILVVTATPRRQSPLDVKREIAELKLALSDLCNSHRVELEILEHANLSRLSERLCESFHVVHFIGHGTFDTTRKCGVLLFEEKCGAEESVDAETLGRVLRGKRIALVFLNACEGARGNWETPFAGLAQNLVKSKIPAVVAMQFPVPDPVAISFARHFYTALARRAPVDQAVSEARQAMVAEHRIWEWGIPVLYLRSPDGRIIQDPWLPGWRAILAVVLVPVLLLTLLWVSLSGRAKEPKRVSPSLGLASFIPPLSEVSTEGCPASEILRMKFVCIEPDTFTMGSKPRDKDEIAHKVTVSKPFCMSEHEVTRGQWKAIMEEEPAGKGADDLPVTVSWDDTQVFLERLNEKEPGKGYRLPTEAQWEYAARAGSTQRFHFGDDPGLLSQYGNCEGNDGFDGLAPVKSFAPNRWELYDMHGNASEWVADWYTEYPPEPVTDPQGPSVGVEKVRRGGSFEIMANNCDAVSRKSSKPEGRPSNTGFRLVRTPEP